MRPVETLWLLLLRDVDETMRFRNPLFLRTRFTHGSHNTEIESKSSVTENCLSGCRLSDTLCEMMIQ